MNEKIVDVWQSETADWITPDTKVWAVKMVDLDFPDGTMFHMAFLSENSLRRNCFWFKLPITNPGTDLMVRSMPFSKYLELHLKNVKGMNPFWDIGRMEFVTKYNKINKQA